MTPLPWQSDVWQALGRRIIAGTIPHAMLFTGPEGVGKRQFAQAFVQRLFCHALDQGLACGKCKACHLLKINNHPDQFWISKPEDKKVISVDQIRGLISYVNLKPHSTWKKVAIIEQAELMNINASNSLLKTLEEPPESSLLILLTHRPDQLLATIRSRCQVLQFTTPDRQQAISWLQAKMGDERQAEKLLSAANGSPLRAMAYKENNLLQQREEQFASLQALMARQAHPVEVANRWLKMDLDMTLYCVTSWISDMIRLKVTPEPPVLSNPDARSELATMSQQSTLTKMLAFHAFIYQIPQLKGANVNEQMILEKILVQWTRLNVC
ncbi:MAG TPA: DNA polymerase III subunit delta' [Gammaproteobacteria bacterium]|nr:DNA polymerase III subunit delta' [Gammaproteobacteria bacterium]